MRFVFYKEVEKQLDRVNNFYFCLGAVTESSVNMESTLAATRVLTASINISILWPAESY